MISLGTSEALVPLVSNDTTRLMPRLSEKPSMAQMTTTTFSIQGMTCGACTAAIESQVNPSKIAGLQSFSISLISERAAAVHDAETVTAASLAESIEDCGFDAAILSTQFDASSSSTSGRSEVTKIKVFGMTSATCVVKIEETLNGLVGIESAVVESDLEELEVTYKTDIVGIRDIVDAIQSLGFDALLADSNDNLAQLESLTKTREVQQWKSTFIKALVLTIPVFLINKLFPHIGLGGFMRTELFLPGLVLGDVLSLALTIPVQFGLGKKFYRIAYRSLQHGSATMDVLVCLGTTAAFAFSILSMIVAIFNSRHPPSATFFDTSGMLITFVSFGRYLENKAKGQTSAALSRLMSLAPSSATIYADPHAPQNSDEERTIPTELLQVGDIVLLKPGSKIPADGVVVAGESFVDESMVTGEVNPAQKCKGNMVMAGTVNGRGRLDFEVERAGRDTQLAQIVRLVQEAQTSKAPIQRFSDVVAGYFVPTVITLGLLTFFTWMVLSHLMHNPPKIFMHDEAGGKTMTCLKLCISVIVVACPCALGLATPTAVMVGTGVAASHGVLIKGGATLETATKITRVVFDKTGTLTIGKLSVCRSYLTDAWASTDLNLIYYSLVGSAEQNSEHPTGKALVDLAKSKLNITDADVIHASTSNFVAEAGQGITCDVQLQSNADHVYKVLVGNQSLLTKHNITISAHHDEIKKDEELGRSTIFVAIDGLYAGTISLSDQIKPDAARTVAALRRMGIEVAMVTGDQRPTALKVAHALGISEKAVWAAVSPAGKSGLLEEMQAAGHIVAMVGDGINDSPALASANVGIALSSGTDVAIEAADLVLMRSNSILDVAVALILSQAIFNRIKLNLLWACLYNLIAIPFAMGFFLPFGLHLHPMIAGGAMAMSSVSVVASSLLLKYWRRPAWLDDDVHEPVSRVKSSKSLFKTINRTIKGGYSQLAEQELQTMPVR